MSIQTFVYDLLLLLSVSSNSEASELPESHEEMFLHCERIKQYLSLITFIIPIQDDTYNKKTI